MKGKKSATNAFSRLFKIALINDKILEKRKKILQKFLGFTFIELLVVMGILFLLFAIVIVAVNPFEQFHLASDITTKAVIKDVNSAIQYYFADQKTFPWQKDASCKQELSTGKTLTDVSSCIGDLTNGGQLQQKFLASSEPKNIYITECSGAVALCFNPKSKKINESPDAKYMQNGMQNPNCPSNNTTSADCYICTFSTNDAQECFQALNPNGNLALMPTPTPNQLLPVPSRHTINTCSTLASGKVRCAENVVSSANGTPFTSIAPPGGFGPVQIHTAYNLPCTPGGSVSSKCTTPITFGPQTIAIVDAYQNPTIESDLAVYDTAYGLPPCTMANSCLTIVNQNGKTSPLPPVDANWGLEEALDVQMAHAVCQTCKILLVEATSNSFSDIGTAVNQAAAFKPTAISNSYGAPEGLYETAMDSYYDHPGIYVTASSGDWGYGAYYPAASKNVIAVGGTTLYLMNNNTYSFESVWNGTGSGCSVYESAYSWQTSLSNWNSTRCGTQRSIVDVSADADPNTGVTVYDSTPYAGKSGWWIVGGTSVSSPIVSAALSLSGTAPSGVEAASYVYQNFQKFRDVLEGSNGNCGTIECNAVSGYDGPTGLGSPNFLSGGLVTPPPTTVTLTPTPTSIPQEQIWITTTDYIYRLNPDGSLAGGKITNGAVDGLQGLLVVGNKIWAANLNNSITFRDFTGAIINTPITGNGLNSPHYMTLVGSQVWVTNDNYGNINTPPTYSISRFNEDGTSAGPPLTGNGMCDPDYIAVVGTQVWVGNYNLNCGGGNNGTISRFNFDGTSAGTPLAGNGLSYVSGIAVVGTQVWVANDYHTNTISRFNFDGTSAGSVLSGNGLNGPGFIGVVGNIVWVGNKNTNSISLFSFNGLPAGSPISLQGITIYSNTVPETMTIVP